MPRDPQGAETRTVWRNVYANQFGNEFRIFEWDTREDADEETKQIVYLRIAVEEVTAVTTITRHPIPPHAGEETKG